MADDQADVGGTTLSIDLNAVALAVGQSLLANANFKTQLTQAIRTQILQQARSMGAAGFFGPNAGTPNATATTKG